MANFTAGTSFQTGVTNDVTAAKLNALVADAVPTSNLALTSTSGTIANFTSSTANITLGTVTTLNSTTGTIGNLSTTLAGDITISQGTATLGTTGATAATYGTTSAIPRITVDAKGRVTAASTVTAPVGFRNRIINGDMRIDQRNAGASVAVTANIYSVDRFFGYDISTSDKFTVQQNAGAITPPAGFTNYLGATSSAATSLVAGSLYALVQRIEGFNIADLAWGTASAAAVTLSFRVYSSLTGTFGGSLTNGAFDRSYPFTYSIPVSNTWTTVSVTIPGDTSGTWLTTNGVGINLSFGLGVGTTYSGTAGAWAGANYFSATGAVSVVGTNGATFYITGVQLEAGSTATEFERRPIGTELALCQRYFSKSYDSNIAVGSNGDPVGGLEYFLAAPSAQTGNLGKNFTFPVPMRAIPTVTTYDRSSPPNSGKVTTNGGGNKTANQIATGQRSTTVYVGGSGESELTFHWAAAAEL
jgi:hypothetical protein